MTFDYSCRLDVLNIQSSFSSSGNNDLDCLFGQNCPVLSILDSPSHQANCPFTVVMEVFLDSISDWVPYDDSRITLAPAVSSYDSSTGSFTVNSASMTSAQELIIFPTTSWNIR